MPDGRKRMKTLLEDRGNEIEPNEPPAVDVHGCKSLTAAQRAVLLTEAMIRANAYLPSGPGDWEDAVDAAVNYVNDHLAYAPNTEAETSIDTVTPIIAQRSHLSYWEAE
jgi:hypothetical protein